MGHAAFKDSCYLNHTLDSDASSGKFSQASVADFGGFVGICRVRFMRDSCTDADRLYIILGETIPQCLSHSHITL